MKKAAYFWNFWKIHNLHWRYVRILHQHDLNTIILIWRHQLKKSFLTKLKLTHTQCVEVLLTYHIPIIKKHSYITSRPRDLKIAALLTHDVIIFVSYLQKKKTLITVRFASEKLVKYYVKIEEIIDSILDVLKLHINKKNSL